jgi:hypothetical protein
MCSRIFRFTHCMHFSAASSPISGIGSTNPSNVNFRLGRGTGHGLSSTASVSASSVHSASPPDPAGGPAISRSPLSPSSPLALLAAAAAAALSATNFACVRRMRRCVLIFAFIMASSERGRGGAGFGRRFLRLFAIVGPVGRSCDLGGEEAGAEAGREGRGGRELAMKGSDNCASHQSSIVSKERGEEKRARLRTRESEIPFL